MVFKIKYGHNKNISKLMTFNFRNNIIFWDIPKWNREQTNWDEGNIFLSHILISLIHILYVIFLAISINIL